MARALMTTKEKLQKRIETLLELPRTDNVQSMLNRLQQELADLGDNSYERDCYCY